jgi:hypothetical protein
MEVCGQLHSPLALPAKIPPYPLDRKLSGPQSRFGRGGEEKNIPYTAPAENRAPVVQPVACSLCLFINHKLSHFFLMKINLPPLNLVLIFSKFSATGFQEMFLLVLNGLYFLSN